MYLFDTEVQRFLSVLAINKVEYMVVGGFAVNYHGYIRTTGDLDLWWNPTADNFQKLLRSIEEFGFDTTDIRSLEKYDNHKSLIRLPLSDNFDIELLSVIDGQFSFDEAARAAEKIPIAKVEVTIIDYVYLIKNKLSSHRPKDMHDIGELNRIKQVISGKKKE
jgi:hypothetical protein